MVHGIKTEGVYAVLAGIRDPRGGLKSSGDKTSEGHRFNADHRGDAKGVYFQTWEQLRLAQNYARWVPLFGDGTYVRFYLETYVDRSYRVT